MDDDYWDALMDDGIYDSSSSEHEDCDCDPDDDCIHVADDTLEQDHLAYEREMRRAMWL